MCSKVKDFLTDDSFINYVFEVTQEEVSYWETYLRNHPEQIVDIEKAKSILLAPTDVACGFLATERKDLKDRIVCSIRNH